MNTKIIKSIIFCGMAASSIASADLPPSYSPICPVIEQIKGTPSTGLITDDPNAYHSCSWSAINNDGKNFASRTDIDCDATLKEWLPAKSEFVDGHKIKCVYQMIDQFNIIYTLKLYNEKGYELNTDGMLVPTTNND